MFVQLLFLILFAPRHSFAQNPESRLHNVPWVCLLPLEKRPPENCLSCKDCIDQDHGIVIRRANDANGSSSPLPFVNLTAGPESEAPLPRFLDYLPQRFPHFWKPLNAPLV